jgi:hypothetical protein
MKVFGNVWVCQRGKLRVQAIKQFSARKSRACRDREGMRQGGWRRNDSEMTLLFAQRLLGNRTVSLAL